MADTPSEDPQQAPDAAGPPAGAPPAEEAAPVKAKEIDRSQVQAIEREVRRSPFLWLTYVLGVALTALLIVGAWYFVRNQEKRSFDFVLRQASAEIERNARSVEAVSYGMQGLFHSVEKVDGDQFRYFSEQAVNRYPFVTETAYYPKILNADREAFEAEAMAAGLGAGIIDRVDIKEKVTKKGKVRLRRAPVRAPERAVYYPLLYKDLGSEDRTRFGLDTYGRVEQKAAIEKSIATGDLVAMPPRVNIAGKLEFEVFVPTYKIQRVPAQQEDRIKEAKGVVGVLIDVEALVATRLAKGDDGAKKAKRLRGSKALRAIMELETDNKHFAPDGITKDGADPHFALLASFEAAVPVTEDEGADASVGQLESLLEGALRPLSVGELTRPMFRVNNITEAGDVPLGALFGSSTIPFTDGQLRLQINKPLFLSKENIWPFIFAALNGLFFGFLGVRIVRASLIRSRMNAVLKVRNVELTEARGKLEASLVEIERINEGLEETVAERTKDLRAVNQEVSEMLDNLDAGVFMVGEELEVVGRQSPACEPMFGISDMTGSDISTTLFAGDVDTDEALAMQLCLLETLVGADDLQWDLAAYNLLQEWNYKHPCPGEDMGEDRVFGLKYAPLYDEDEMIEKILVVATDLTELLALRKQAEEQQAAASRKTAALMELVSGKRSEVRQVLPDMAARIGRAAESLSSWVKTHDPQDVVVMCRELHTIKGNARLVGMQSISKYVHELESKCIVLKDADAKHGDDTLATIQESMDGGVALIVSYVEVHDEFLSDSGGDDGSTVDLSSFQRRLEAVKSVIKDEPKAAISSIDAMLELLGASAREEVTSVGELFTGYANMVAELSEQLGKQIVPLAETLGDSDVFVPNELSGFIREAMTHTIRNALDHGIEKPDAREALGKDAVGKLWLEFEDRGDTIVVAIRDDGGGVNTEKVLELARAKGVLAPSDPDPDGPDAIIDLLFHAGFSTKEEATDVSGRGVGLDAVRASLLNYDIETRLASVRHEGSQFLLTIPKARIAFVELDGSISKIEQRPAVPVSIPPVPAQ